MSDVWTRATNGTLGAITALAKSLPGRLFFSGKEESLTAQKIFVERSDGSLRELAWKDEVSASIASAIDAIPEPASSHFINTPVINGASTSTAGSTVALTAVIPEYVWGGISGVSVKWLMPDKSIRSGTSLTLTTPATIGEEIRVECFAEGTSGTTSGKRLHILSAAANSIPSVANVVSNLPANLTLGNSITVILSGATDVDGEALTYVLTNLIGCAVNVYETSGSFILTVVANATQVSFSARARDSKGAQSSSEVTFTRGAANLIQPTGTSGNLSTGTHTVVVPIGVSTVTLIGNGGAGVAYVACTPSYNQWCDGDSGCYSYSAGCYGGNAAAAGAATGISGAVSHTFSGAASGVASVPASSTAVYGVPTNTTKTLTIIVAGSGGNARVNW